MKILNYIHKIPIGYSVASYSNQKYGVTRTDFNNGNSIKVYAQELGGTNFVSLNIYITSSRILLKPCEMPEEKVIHFLHFSKIIPVNTK